MKAFIKRFMCLALALCMVFGTSVVAFAATDSEKESAVKAYIRENVTVKDDGNITYSDASLRTELSTKAPTDEPKSVTLKDGVTTVYYSAKDLDILYNKVVKAADTAALGDKVSKMTDGFKVDADIDGAAKMLSGFQPLLALVVGIICYLAVMFMGLFTSFDVCYIAFPVFRDKCEDMKASGNQFTTKKTSSGETSLRWVTDEAQYAVKESQLSETGKSPWGIYLKKRALAYILMAVIIFILLTGNIDLLINIALKVIGGVMDVLSSLAS